MDETKQTVDETIVEHDNVGDQVSLVSDEERLTLVIGVSSFFYRRMPNRVRNRLIQKHTKMGNTNWGKFITDAMQWGLFGWKNVNDHGQPIEFEHKLIERLPQDTQLELQQAMGASIAQEDERQKNS